MSNDLIARIVDLLAFITLATIFILIWSNTVLAQVRAFMAQSFALASLALLLGIASSRWELVGVSLVVLLLKVGLIPWVLRRTIKSIGLRPESAPYLNTSLSLALAGIFVVVAYLIVAPLQPIAPKLTANVLPLALAGVFIGFLLTFTRRRALTQILGFLVLENSIFMFSLLATFGVSFIIEAGAFLDLLVGVLILEVFTHRIRENFDSHDVDQLGELKG